MENEDAVGSFIGDNLEFGPDSRTGTRELHEAFNRYLDDRGHRPWTARAFTTRFGGHEKCTRNGVRLERTRDYEGARRRTWSGVGLRNPAV